MTFKINNTKNVRFHFENRNPEPNRNKNEKIGFYAENEKTEKISFQKSK